MILADKIINERKRNGWSQEQLAEKLSVSRQAVSKWEGAQSVPDLQRITKMADLFGVTTDYLLKDEIEPSDFPAMKELARNGIEAGENSCGVPLRRVSMEEANEYLRVRKEVAPFIGLGVSLCILSPALLIMLAGFSDSHIWGLSENMAAGTGLTVLLVMVAAAVFIFITRGSKEKRFEFLSKDDFETEYGVTGMVKERQKQSENRLTARTAAGVILCILSVIPLVVSGILEAPDYVCCGMVSVLLVLVAAGVYILISAGMESGSYNVLLQEGEFTSEEKKRSRKTEPFGGIYWCTVTAVYLGWSFWSGRWDFTWIIWPVAGVLFAALTALLKVIIKGK